jgi:uncharacterized membrane protein YhaH (DUF805 family)
MTIQDNHQDLELKDFFQFQGRINRAKYFDILGWNIAVQVTLVLLSGSFKAIGTQSDSAAWLSLANVFLWLFAAAALVGNISLLLNSIRRVHDCNLSGWFSIIPVYSIYLVFFKKGTAGENDYGNDPLAQSLAPKTVEEEKFNSQQKVFRTLSLVCIVGGLGALAFLFFTGYLS